MPTDDPLTDQTSALVRLANQTFRAASPEQLARRWHRLKVRTAGERMRGGRFRLQYAALASALAVVLGVGAYVGIGRSKAKLTYEIDGARPMTQDYVETNADERATLRFSDGTDVALQTDARMRLSSVDSDGPRLLLEKGEAHVHVFHREGVQWRFDAGPYLVVVKGTSFVVRWNENEKEFNLRLRSGAVTVSGPLTSGQLQVREGQVLSARLKEGEIVLREDKPEPAPAATAPAPSPVESPAPEAERGSPSRDHRTGDGARNWPRKLASGKVAQVLAEAQAFGIESVLEDATAADLEALGDAARYSGREDIARSALLAERRRFSNSPRAARAAFFMGRLEDAANSWQNALTWYETYLREAPAGTYASEALGGKMAAVRHAYGNERASPIAREYMRRFPNGSYAAAARVLVSQP